MSSGVAEASPKYLSEMASSAVPAGYKKTEVGVIPEDWEVDLLSSVCAAFKTGKLDANAMKPDGEYRFYTCAREYSYIDRYAFECEALLVSGNGANVGYVHYFKGKFNAYQRTYVLSDFLADVIYLKIYLERKLAERIRVEVNAGNTPYITMDTLTDMPIVLPSKAEQTAIANALSDVDALISELEKLIAKKQAIKTATMQQLLTGRTRLPQFAQREDGTKKGTKKSELGEIPEDWRVVILGDISNLNMGQSPSSGNYNAKGIGLPLIQGNADISNRKTIIRNYTSQITKKANKGDLLISVRAPVGEVAIAEFDCCIGRGVCAIRYPNSYLYHWLINFESQWEKFSKGSTFDSINSDELRTIQLVLPSNEEQTAIATILSDMDEEIQALEQRLGKTRQIKQGMMQELLTGKTRLIQGSEAR